jgi:hypothetical protein
MLKNSKHINIAKMLKQNAVAFCFIPAFLFSAVSCLHIEEYDNDPKGNFEALWTILDEHYCFFDCKNVDWDSIHAEYSTRVHPKMTDLALFDVLNAMLQELKDGHVNLITPFDLGRYWKWFEDYPPNFDANLIDSYLGADYAIAGGFRYKVFDDNCGYLRYPDFSSGIGETNLDYILTRLAGCHGIIIDVRDNGGGLLSNVEKLASRFVETKTLTGYISHKTGKAHEQFSEPFARYIEPSSRCRYTKPVVILTNRSCYSATNDFVNAMRYCPNVTVIGDCTGGGSGLPFNSELPNGWAVRFSACPVFDADMQHIEFGINPDIAVNLWIEDALNGRDTMIEYARIYLNAVQKADH